MLKYDAELRHQITHWLASSVAGHHHDREGGREILPEADYVRVDAELDRMAIEGLVDIREDDRFIATGKLKLMNSEMWPQSLSLEPPPEMEATEPIKPAGDSMDALYRAIRDTGEASRKAKIRAGILSESALDLDTGSWVNKGWTLREITQRVNALKPDILAGLSDEAIKALATAYDKRMTKVSSSLS